MSIGSVTSPTGPPGSAPRAAVEDPQVRQAKVNAQADLLLAVRGVNLPGIAAARLNDGGGIDLHL